MTEIILLDGGIGQEIVQRAGDKPTPLWSTQAMIDHPGVVADVHRAYFDAGATVATTNTYPILRDRLVRFDMEDQFLTLLDAAVSEAKSARSAHPIAAKTARIAGAIGPLGASYRPDLLPPHDQAVPLFHEVAAHLAPSVDILICETVSSLAHARAVLEGASGLGRPVWLSVSVSDDDGTMLRSGEALSDLGPLLKDTRPAAVLANCSVPEVMADALAILKGFGLPFGAYANGFRRISKAFLEEAPTVDALEARNDLGPSEYADFAMHWVDMGATIVGGCCETGPAHIAEIARRLDRAGFQIV